MTWSIVARDADGSFGVAVASRFFAVGALCPHARAASARWRRRRSSIRSTAGRRSTRSQRGEPPGDVVRAPDRRRRRPRPAPAAPDRRARAASPRTPASACVDWCGHRSGDGYSVAGNMLAGAEVLDATAAAYRCRRRPAARRAPARGACRRRSRRRRQARQAGGGARHLHDRGLPGARPARRRPRRADRRAAPPVRRRASSASSPSSPACRAATIRSASPIAPRSRRASRASRRRRVSAPERLRRRMLC